MINPMTLKGKTILITGASSGIGRSVAIQASKLGATLILIARRKKALKETQSLLCGENHRLFSLDLSQSDKTDECIKALKHQNIKIDGFVYGAGYGKKEVFPEIKRDFAHYMMDVNVFAFNEMIKALYKDNMFNEKGSIVAISSTAALNSDDKELAYAMSKAALDASVSYHAKVLSKEGIRVNSILPGWVKTPMYEAFLKTYGETPYAKNDLKKQSLGLIEPSEVANLACFLLSDATLSITGSHYLIDGGFLL